MKNIILLLMVSIGLQLSAQNYAKDWHLRYTSLDTNFGIGLTEALRLNNAPANAKQVIVAVIDDGVDILHPDLKGQIWVNTNEIPGNAVDDDHNGYIDDMNGWDFLGSMGEDITYDNLEITRLLRDYRKRFENKSSKNIPKNEKADFKAYKKLELVYEKELKKAETEMNTMKFYKKLVDALLAELDSSNVSLKTLSAFEPNKVEAKYAQSIAVSVCRKEGISPKEFFDGILEDYKHTYERVNYHLNLDFDSRKTIGDNYLDANALGYGNQDVRGPDALHGTHVAGIIGAVRNNGLGMDGICPLVKIMVLRVVPNGDERDKDVAHAIRYAVDNGAKVINMSFGKYYSFNSAIVHEAIHYAELKDVLMVHAAGNENSDIDHKTHFPTAEYSDDSSCRTWIEVGASDRNQAAAEFSNYGRETVDVFAPGVQIYSTITNNAYKFLDGTSMASPVVAGLAALIRAYYPMLTAVQVKRAIESSVVKPVKKVRKPGKKRKKVHYKKLCRHAGIVNAGNALKAASAMH